MKRFLKTDRALILFILFLFAHNVTAQYLVISRPANIKQTPHKNSLVIEKAARGDYFWLLDNGDRVKGYYHVITSDQFSTGYIYRSLVRRKDGYPDL